DNKIGTADDRYINTAKNPTIQAMFTGMQAMAAQAFRSTDAEYAAQLLAASQRCWEANKRGSRSAELAWWARAAAELYRATGNDRWQTEAVALGRRLLELQETRFVGGQKLVRGFWRTGPNQSEPYTDAVHASLPPLVLLELAETFDEHPDAKRWLDAVRLHLSEYVAPMCARSAYGILPFGIFIGSPTPESYRPLAGELTYRYFMPVRKQYWWVGTTSHLLSYAYLLARAARVLKDNAWRDLAYRQMEWVMGANPFGACLMTGEGIRNPYPHSRFVGLIIGGIMNGIGGNVRDEPVLDTENGYDWRTTEYWSPHNAYYISAVSALG
ncbi:MAG TPA: glycoside hydrolase family 9 protein, partial [Bryobacteraceae bacterium]|nr:glycoside hydrolase family 9 protein [Bryobacteraceae bacterium]